MAIGSLKDAERNSFVETVDGPARRVEGNLSIKPSGLNVGGVITEITLNSGSWTALPTTALTNRNAIAIQNNSGIEIKLNYDNLEPTYLGIVLADGNERSYDITDSIVIYAKASSGTPVIVVEEIA